MRTFWTLEYKSRSGTWCFVTSCRTKKDARRIRDDYYSMSVTRFRKWKPA